MTNNQLTSTHLAVKSELDGYKIHASRGQATAMAMVRLFESIDRDLEELQERRQATMNSEPVAWRWRWSDDAEGYWRYTEEQRETRGSVTAQPLYRHAQQPVVPNDVLAAIQKVARIHLDLNDFDGDRRGIADCLCDAEEALIEVVNRRAAMLAAAPQEVKP